MTTTRDLVLKVVDRMNADVEPLETDIAILILAAMGVSIDEQQLVDLAADVYYLRRYEGAVEAVLSVVLDPGASWAMQRLASA